jgi:hypothetical protein
MKKFKQLKQQLMEGGENMDGGALGQWPTNGPDSAVSDYGVHRIESEEQIQRLQAFLNTFTKKEYIDPRAALSLLRVKLNLAGLDFDFNNNTEVTAERPMVLHLKRFGGTFGVTPTTDLTKEPFKVTDGVEDVLGGDHLVLNTQIQENPQSGLFKLNIRIEQVSGNPENSKTVLKNQPN